jgi:hypothetical protein
MYSSEGNLEEQSIWVLWNNWLKINDLTTICNFISSDLKGGCKSINLCIVLYLLNRIDFIIEKQMSFILPSIATQIINTS